MKWLISSVLGNVSPAQLKKYGIYAILSLFITACIFISMDDIRVRNRDIEYERSRNEYLSKLLNQQYQLKMEQEQLLQIIDTLNHEAD